VPTSGRFAFKHIDGRQNLQSISLRFMLALRLLQFLDGVMRKGL
jgi:hypothetical protein